MAGDKKVSFMLLTTNYSPFCWIAHLDCERNCACGRVVPVGTAVAEPLQPVKPWSSAFTTSGFTRLGGLASEFVLSFGETQLRQEFS